VTARSGAPPNGGAPEAVAGQDATCADRPAHDARMRVTRRSIAAVGVIAAAVGAALVVRPRLAEMRASLRISSSPGVRAYELLFGAPLGRFYAGIAEDCARALESVTEPAVLEVGPGPGHLAVRILEAVPSARWTGLDIDPAMVAAAQGPHDPARLGARASCVEGDVAALPFGDASFDLVISSLSVHHWADAAAGFAEVRRVVRPGGTVIAYDLPGWWGRFETGSSGLRAGVDALPDAAIRRSHGIGPVALVERLEATRP
jgi:SAM-dependent methyltransferase